PGCLAAPPDPGRNWVRPARATPADVPTQPATPRALVARGKACLPSAAHPTRRLLATARPGPSPTWGKTPAYNGAAHARASNPAGLGLPTDSQCGPTRPADRQPDPARTPAPRR